MEYSYDLALIVKIDVGYLLQKFLQKVLGERLINNLNVGGLLAGAMTAIISASGRCVPAAPL